VRAKKREQEDAYTSDHRIADRGPRGCVNQTLLNCHRNEPAGLGRRHDPQYRRAVQIIFGGRDHRLAARCEQLGRKGGSKKALVQLGSCDHFPLAIGQSTHPSRRQASPLHQLEHSIRKKSQAQDKPDLALLKDRHDYIQPKVAGHSASEQV
jgi:hypothetical protein